MTDRAPIRRIGRRSDRVPGRTRRPRGRGALLPRANRGRLPNPRRRGAPGADRQRPGSRPRPATTQRSGTSWACPGPSTGSPTGPSRCRGASRRLREEHRQCLNTTTPTAARRCTSASSSPGSGPADLGRPIRRAAHTRSRRSSRSPSCWNAGLFDAFFLGEGLRVRENRGRSSTSMSPAGPTRSPSCRRSPRSPSASAWSPPRTPLITTRPTSPAGWPASISFPTAGPAGTS